MIFQRPICKAIYYLQQLIAAHNTLLAKISNDLDLTDEQEKDGNQDGNQGGKTTETGVYRCIKTLANACSITDRGSLLPITQSNKGR